MSILRCQICIDVERLADNERKLPNRTCQEIRGGKFQKDVHFAQRECIIT